MCGCDRDAIEIKMLLGQLVQMPIFGDAKKLEYIRLRPH